VKLVGKRGAERKAWGTGKPCVLGGGGGGAGGGERGGRERKRDTENETEFAAGKKAFSSWSRAGGMFSRHDKGGKYFI
jgi:hypothetical protein